MDEPAPAPRARPTSHILASASTMIDVSTTLIGLVKVVEGRIGESRVDEFAGIATVLFLMSAVMSFASMRLESRPRAGLAIERVADALFLIGLVCTSAIALFFAYEMI